MTPKLQYVAQARMEDQSLAPFTVGKAYEINCAFCLDGVTHISAIDDNQNIHHFDIEEEWFSQSFIIDGDIHTVWEEV